MGYSSLLTDNIKGQQIGDTMFDLDGGVLIWDGNEWLQTDGTGLVEVTAHGDAERKFIPTVSFELEGDYIGAWHLDGKPMAKKQEPFRFKKGISGKAE